MRFITIKNSDENDVVINPSKVLYIIDHKHNRSIDVGGERPIYTDCPLDELLALLKNE